jgi:hypothetical protein
MARTKNTRSRFDDRQRRRGFGAGVAIDLPAIGTRLSAGQKDWLSRGVAVDVPVGLARLSTSVRGSRFQGFGAGPVPGADQATFGDGQGDHRKCRRTVVIAASTSTTSRDLIGPSSPRSVDIHQRVFGQPGQRDTGSTPQRSIRQADRTS